MSIYAVICLDKLVRNSLGNKCSNNKAYDENGLYLCNTDWMTTLSIANYGLTADGQEKGLLILAFFILVVVHISCLHEMDNLKVTIDSKRGSCEDYSLMISKLPYDETEESLKFNIEEMWKTVPQIGPVKVAKISLGFKLEEYTAVKNRHAEIFQQKLSLFSKKKKTRDTSIDAELIKINVEEDKMKWAMEQIQQKLKNRSNPEDFTGVAIVSF